MLRIYLDCCDSKQLTYLVRVINKRKRPVLLLDLSRLRGRRNAEDGKRVETLDLRVVRHRVHQVEEASPTWDQRQQLTDRFNSISISISIHEGSGETNGTGAQDRSTGGLSETCVYGYKANLIGSTCMICWEFSSMLVSWHVPVAGIHRFSCLSLGGRQGACCEDQQQYDVIAVAVVPNFCCRIIFF